MSHDDKVLVVRDAYPKARHHVLVIARDAALTDIACLRREHLGLLRHMKSVAHEWAAAHAADIGPVRTPRPLPPSMRAASQGSPA